MGVSKGRVPAGGPGGTSGLKRCLSFMAGFMLLVLLASEIIVVVSYVVPTFGILLFQAQGITIDRSIAIGDFAMADAVVLCMMWGGPMIVMCILAAMLEWQVIRHAWRWISGFLRAAFGRGTEGGGSE